MKRMIAIVGFAALLGALALSLWPENGSVPFRAEPCQDDDPCTIDRYHRFQGRCIHVPDALCSKPCQSKADCEYPRETAPCLEAQCHEGECRYMKIARTECTHCDAQTPCEGSYCDPRQCDEGFCRHAPRDCDDNNPNTRDRCDEEAQRCVHETADSNEVRACTVNQDCIRKEGLRCFAGPCEDGFCRFREVPNSRCQPCTGDHDCEGSFCNWPICTGTVCVTEKVPFCTDDNPLTEDICSEERRGCFHRYREQPPPCSNAPLSDNDPSTIDFCHTETGETHHLPSAPGLCQSTNKCWYTYQGPDGWCLGVELTCHHDDACPASCDPSQGCVLDPNRDCHCKTHEDCNLGNPCARVFCLREDGGACWGTFIDHCIPCRNDHDCRVDNWCVYGECSDAGYCIYRDGYTCDDNNPDTFGFCHGQRDDPCTYEPIYDYN